MEFISTKKIWLLLLLFCAIGKNYAQPSLFSKEKYSNGKGDTLNYRMLFPDADTLRRFPLVIFLHGSGEKGTDNEAQLKWGVGNFATSQAMSMHPCFVIAPQCPPKQEWANTIENKNEKTKQLQPMASKPMELLIELIHQLITKFKIDSNRIYITGLSMGGHGTYDAIERYPNLFAAAVPVCGSGDASKAATIAHIPIWMFHGAEDPSVPIVYSIKMVDALNRAGALPGLTIYPEVGHFSWIAAYNDPLMMEWLFRQHK